MVYQVNFQKMYVVLMWRSVMLSCDIFVLTQQSILLSHSHRLSVVLSCDIGGLLWETVVLFCDIS